MTNPHHTQKIDSESTGTKANMQKSYSPDARFMMSEWVTNNTHIRLPWHALKNRQRREKSRVENEFSVFRLLLASDWRKRVDYIHSSTKSWILEQFWCDIFTRKSLRKQITDDVFYWFWDDFPFLPVVFPHKNQKYTNKISFLRNEEIFFFRIWFYSQVYA